MFLSHHSPWCQHLLHHSPVSLVSPSPLSFSFPCITFSIIILISLVSPSPLSFSFPWYRLLLYHSHFPDIAFSFISFLCFSDVAFSSSFPCFPGVTFYFTIHLFPWCHLLLHYSCFPDVTFSFTIPPDVTFSFTIPPMSPSSSPFPFPCCCFFLHHSHFPDVTIPLIPWCCFLLHHSRFPDVTFFFIIPLFP